VGGITAEMKRILDLDKIIEDREKEKQKSNYWQRIKNDPVKFDHYQKWRKQYVNKKKEALPPVVAAVPFKFVRI
jgi:predicted DNA binding CopG/RHH family protein